MNPTKLIENPVNDFLISPRCLFRLQRHLLQQPDEVNLQVGNAISPSGETACPVEGGGWKNVFDCFIEVRRATWG